ncbi:DUF2330 domain-containing protein [Dolichospermum circinale]|uniref:DUF2330 domain-containing protein n=1 Tax=Dolichospermum circinale TaxID=109265 RepID=UPI0004879E71|nr:DUF2330 domain-containing protein [Dolichospermum circinale]MDB9454149.1 DUF2330 domain-containing protein [Dolichospermum circinale CS-541/06]MDB9464647.1 DUF2330 domain-containing protein [Dolichospermum circinale CS-541/04]MDB9476971.1 DUF2330 domain-containing protein [Dolichospermum circinale CS-537/11]MDB9478126.1 DUF2330 domain-containing protein [Dolichospermum circinale CS-537/03]MDB9491720.1 DUF2330 domain-containing protein [Dolichospermum circinale CS-534/05]
MKKLRLFMPLVSALLAVLCFAPTAWAFCGFYVAKADTKLYNQASQVILARDGNRTVLTMANDFQGDVKDFAIVVPVPTVLQKEQVHVAEPKIIERLDAFSAPRLVEYFDSDPCAPVYKMNDMRPMQSAAPPDISTQEDSSLGVTVEAKFNVGEYDIVILSAKESGGLETWLNRNGYKIPQGAKELLKPYIRSGMKFFVAKVNLDKFAESGYQFLRPLQISYESRKFMLPIRLGMVNATKEQDLIIYILSPKGQAEITNYRTVKVPSDVNIPVFVKNQFGDFYKSMFQNSYTKEDKKVGFLEYAWDMGTCDPCAAEPLNNEELKQAGVFWLNDNSDSNSPIAPGFRSRFPSSSVFITRLHVRYTRNKFPEDLIFQETAQRDSFQGRYILQHPFTGKVKCSAGRRYKSSLKQRFEQEAQNLARLTNWNIQDIRQKMKLSMGNISNSWWDNFLSWRRL